MALERGTNDIDSLYRENFNIVRAYRGDVRVFDKPIMYVVGHATPENIHKLDTSLSPVLSQSFPVNYGANTFCIAKDSNENIYVGGAVNSLIDDTPTNFRKYNSKGELIWAISAGSNTVRDIAIDKNDNIFVGNLKDNGSSVLRKYDTDGILLDSVSISENVFRIALDSTGNIYVANGSDGVIDSLRKYNSSFTLVWSKLLPTLLGIALDKDNNIFAVGNSSSGIAGYKYDNDGNQLATFSHVAFLDTVTTDIDGKFYFGGGRGAGELLTVKKFLANGTLEWAKDTGAEVRALVVDEQKNVYAAGAVSSGISLRKYSEDGTLLTSSAVASTSFFCRDIILSNPSFTSI
jgi:hypothetical protein